jgi:hypothetical protein
MRTSAVSGSRRIETARRGKVSPAGGRPFADHLSAGALGDAQQVLAPSGIPVIDGLLAVQEVENDPQQEARREALRHGADVLQQLDDLRHDILAGRVPEARLRALANTLASRIALATDPDLAAVLEEIHLRAEVELAKLDTAP